MPFRFSLQAVLRCRESFEHRERQRLEAITREVIKAQQQREQAKLDRANALGQLQKKLRQGMTAMEMQFELACDRVTRPANRRVERPSDQAGGLAAPSTRDLSQGPAAAQNSGEPPRPPACRLPTGSSPANATADG